MLAARALRRGLNKARRRSRALSPSHPKLPNWHGRVRENTCGRSRPKFVGAQNPKGTRTATLCLHLSRGSTSIRLEVDGKPPASRTTAPKAAGAHVRRVSERAVTVGRVRELVIFPNVAGRRAHAQAVWAGPLRPLPTRGTPAAALPADLASRLAQSACAPVRPARPRTW